MSTTVLPNSAFLHIPKTGGTWIFGSLWKMDLVDKSFSHITAPELRLLTDKPIFTFVRNPLTWYQSRWAAHKPRTKSRNSLVDFKTKGEKNNFNVWLRRVTSQSPNHVTRMYKNYLGGGFNKGVVKFIGKTESLEKDFRRFLFKLGEKYNPEMVLPAAVNRGIVLDRRYTEKMLLRVIDLEIETLEYFGYPKDIKYYENLLK